MAKPNFNKKRTPKETKVPSKPVKVPKTPLKHPKEKKPKNPVKPKVKPPKTPVKPKVKPSTTTKPAKTGKTKKVYTKVVSPFNNKTLNIEVTRTGKWAINHTRRKVLADERAKIAAGLKKAKTKTAIKTTSKAKPKPVKPVSGKTQKDTKLKTVKAPKVAAPGKAKVKNKLVTKTPKVTQKTSALKVVKAPKSSKAITKATGTKKVAVKLGAKPAKNAKAISKNTGTKVVKPFKSSGKTTKRK
jgi:hypothetical protein